MIQLFVLFHIAFYLNLFIHLYIVILPNHHMFFFRGVVCLGPILFIYYIRVLTTIIWYV